MPYSQCIITGSNLVVEGEKWVHGDLHILEAAYVFNAVLDRRGEAAWVYGEPHPDAKALVVQDPAATFERRGVVVVALSAAELNVPAKRYVGGN